MAKKTSRSSLMEKLGSAGAKAIAAHKDDETTLSGGGDLPEGIDGGVAQLVDCEFSNYKTGDLKGEIYFRAAGIVVEPDQVGNIKVKGLRTQIIEPICETSNRSRKTVEDHLQWVLNEMRKLGVDTSEVDKDNLEETAAALGDEKPFFNFRTWKGDATKQYPNPRVNHDWRGTCDYVETENGEDVTEETEDDPKDELEDETKEASVDADTELGTLADSGDIEAQLKITELAEASGFDPDTYETWSDVFEALGSPQHEEGDKETEPKKGEIYGYKPPRARKPVDCEVTAVFAVKKTCNLKSLNDGKSFKSVAWSKLTDE